MKVLMSAHIIYTDGSGFVLGKETGSYLSGPFSEENLELYDWRSHAKELAKEKKVTVDPDEFDTKSLFQLLAGIGIINLGSLSILDSWRPVIPGLPEGAVVIGAAHDKTPYLAFWEVDKPSNLSKADEKEVLGN